MLPLQDEGSYILVGVFVLLLLAGSTGYWTYIDGANRRVDRTRWWGAVVFWLLLLVCFRALSRSRSTSRNAPIILLTTRRTASGA